MKRKIIVKRYSEAYVSLAKGSVGIEKAIEELRELKIILHTNPDFETFLYNPEISVSDKNQVIDKILERDFSELTRNFLKLLLDKGRMEYIVNICDYVRVVYSHSEGLETLLVSSYPLDLEVIQEIKDKLEKKFNRKLNLYLDINPDLLGGLQIRVGNLMIDGSVKRRLDELKEKLMIVQVR